MVFLAFASALFAPRLLCLERGQPLAELLDFAVFGVELLVLS
jgi:hypothetical protein